MPGDDLKQYVDSKEDFYAALGVESSATDAEIRRAYRQTAKKYHPDKVGASNKAALDKFHDLQIAYDVLSDATVKELYDNARRAREEHKARQAAFDGRRKAMIDELEARESGSNKRKRDQAEDEANLERELQRLAEDGKKRRQAREEQLRQEMREAESADRAAEAETSAPALVVDDMDRSVAFRFKKEQATEHLDEQTLRALFSRFGHVEAIVLKQKRRKPPGEKHKVEYWTGIVLYKSIASAHAAVTDFDRLQASDGHFELIESVTWANKQEPDLVPKPTTQSTASVSPSQLNKSGVAQSQPAKTSKFSFNIAKHAQQAPHSNGLDDVLKMRLKNAEKRRLEQQQQQMPAV